MDRRCYDPTSGLFFHAWDEQRAQAWANPQTGCSQSFWGRSIGWYAMALVDSLELLPADHRGTTELKGVLRRLADGLLRHQDAKSGLWWQVVDQPGRDGNYLESSCSAMFCYALAKAVRSGWLPQDRYLDSARRGFAGLLRHRVRQEPGGMISLTHICEVAGLGFLSGKGRPRDGSFDYYIHEPQRDNDPKGVGPFILAGIELQRLEPRPNADSSCSDPAASVILPQFREQIFRVSLVPEGHPASADESGKNPLQEAIDACNAAGGGCVEIPSGRWLTKPIELKSGVRLHLDDDAVLLFSSDPADYPVVPTRWEGVECSNYAAMIRADGQSHIAITGKGIIDGQASTENWWAWNRKQPKPSMQQAARDRLFQMAASGVPPAERGFGPGGFLRPNLIQFQRCRYVLIDGVKLRRAPMWVIHPVLCSHVTIRGVDVTSHGPNNDGCDPESCQWVLIEDCSFDTGDDCIAIKSGRNHDGRRVAVPSQDIVIRRCRMRDGHGGVVIGSEISGGASRVWIEDCDMDSPNLERALRIKSNAMRGGTISDIRMKNVRIGQVAEAVLAVDLIYEEGASGNWPPSVRGIHLEKVTCKQSPRVMRIEGFDGAKIDDIACHNCVFEGLSQPEILHHTERICFSQCEFRPANSAPSANRIGPGAR